MWEANGAVCLQWGRVEFDLTFVTTFTQTANNGG